MREFDKQQKIAIITFGCMVIFIFFGAAWQFKTRINKPFESSASEKNAKVNFGCASGDCEKEMSNLMNEVSGTATGNPVASGELEMPSYLQQELLGEFAEPLVNIGELDFAQETELQNILNGQGSPSSLRAFLLKGGMDKDMLSQISDDDLVKIYKESLQENIEGDSSVTNNPLEN